MGGGTSRPQPEIRTYVGGQLAGVIESTDGSRRSALRSQKSNYSVPSFKEPAQPEQPRPKAAALQIDPDSPSQLSEAVSSPNESPGGTWVDPTAGHVTPTRVDTVRALHFPLSHSFSHTNLKSPCAEQATSPGGVPGGVKALQPLPKAALDPLTKLDSRRASVADGTVAAELAALRAELADQRKATESLATETQQLRGQFSKQLANLTHLVMTMSSSSDAAHSGKTQAWKDATADGPEADSASPESDGAASSDGPSPVANGRVRSKSGKERRRRMSLNAMTTAGV